MKIELRNGEVHISGYVNAVGRDSMPITKPDGSQFVEMIEPGTFREALTRAKNIDVLLNHDNQRKIGCTSGGNLKLKEDNIGLYADFSTSDGDVVNMARNNELRGWSFGMYVNKDEMEQRSGKIPRRHVQNMDIYEVSIINNKMTPCYAGTSLECRSDSGESFVKELRSTTDEIDFTDFGEEKRAQWQEKVDAIRARDSISAWEERLAELRFNPYHDPTNGRFTTSDGGGMGGVLYSKGGKSSYVVSSDLFSKKDKELDSELIRQANAHGSNAYDSGSAVERKYKKSISEIESLNISDEEKTAAKEKVYELSSDELKARSQYIDFYTAGPARSTNTSKNLDKAISKSAEHESYMKTLRDKSAKNTKAEREAKKITAFKEASSTGALETTIDGKTYFRTNKKSNTWKEGNLKDYKAEQAFWKTQKDLPMYQRKSWSQLSSDEKSRYYNV